MRSGAEGELEEVGQDVQRALRQLGRKRVGARAARGGSTDAQQQGDVDGDGDGEGEGDEDGLHPGDAFEVRQAMRHEHPPSPRLRH